MKDRVKFSTKRLKKRKMFCGSLQNQKIKQIGVNTSKNRNSSIANSEFLM